MSIRVHQLAKRCGITNKDLLAKLRLMNYPVKTHSSTVDNITAEALQKEYGYKEPPPPPPPVPKPEKEEKKEADVPVAEKSEAEIPIAPSPNTIPEATMPKVAPVSEPQQSPSVPLPSVPKKSPVEQTSVFQTPTIQQPIPIAAKEVSQKTASRPMPAQAQSTVAATATAVEPSVIIDKSGNKIIQMKPPIVVRDLAQRIGRKAHLLLTELMQMNVFASINETIGEEIARKLCEHHGFVFELEKRERGAGAVHAPPKKVEVLDEEDRPEDLVSRPPVVTFMGHVDHGKTSLLDAIRETNIVARETGGITQHIGASVVTQSDGKQITFLDTPGHEAFTKMRARGANITDIAVLVVAADDGIMPQTIEAINHARAAEVPIIVAINKCDLAAANPDRVKKQLQEHGLAPESWGGDTITADVSATAGTGLKDLLEMILLQAEIMELKASPKRAAKGNVIESQVESGMGPTATVLVRKGTLRVGDAIICGPHDGKVRALINDRGQRVKEATPSTPVKIVGLTGLPDAGSEFLVVKNEKAARELSEQRKLESRSGGPVATGRTTLEDLMGQFEAGTRKKLPLIIKSDVQGSLEAISESLGKLNSDKVELSIIHGAVGSINENDVLLASASDAVIVGFRVKTESGVTDTAKREGVQIKLYSIIYELIDQVEEAMLGLLEPETKEIITGHAEIRKTFQLTKGPAVAGCVVSDGRISRSSRVRLIRRKAVQFEGRVAGLRHYQDDVKELKAGQECGIRLENFNDYQVGDVLEFYSVEKVPAKA